MTMPRRLSVCLAVLALTAAMAAPAGAGYPSPATGVQLCSGGTATFYGRMRAVAGTERMAMRFTLLERFGDGKLQPVDLPGLRPWRFSKPGVRDFRFRQTVTALEGGGAYRARIDFRWLDSDGDLLRKRTRNTGACVQAGQLPNLLQGPISAVAGPEGTEVYVVRIQNSGKVAASGVAVELYVDGAAANVGHIDSVGPGETREVRFTGPVCKSNLRVVIDPSDTVKERIESDNATKAACPPRAG